MVLHFFEDAESLSTQVALAKNAERQTGNIKRANAHWQRLM